MAYNMIKICRVSPATNVAEPLILPLSFFDLVWLRDIPANRVTFYKLSESLCERFYSEILPKLEQSLSVVLAHFLPLSGHLKWNQEDPKPHIIVLPEDALSLTVVETDADFSHLSGKGLRYQSELRALVPELPASSDSASILTLKITLFPNQGFCIGATVHHAVVDGKTMAKFLKSWAHICKYGTISQDFDLPMLLDRTLVNVPAELGSKIFERPMYLSEGNANVRSLEFPAAKDIEEDVCRVAFELTRENVKKLRLRAKGESTSSDLLHLSTFVVTYAYVLTCVVKARGVNADQSVPFTFAADFRDRLDPPVPESYVGNCVIPITFSGYKAKMFLGEDGLVNAFKILSDSITDLNSRGAESIWELYEEGVKKIEPGTQKLSVAGSNKFGIYGSDFGWGRPVHAENISISRNLLFSLSDSRDENGGVEIGMCLKKCEMDVFISLFQSGLKY